MWLSRFAASDTVFCMPHYVDPAGFEGHPLILRRRSEGDYEVIVRGMGAGRILAQDRSASRRVWLWTVTGPHLPDQLKPGHGEADNIDDAKAAFQAKFHTWQAWAVGQQHMVVWNVGVERQ